MSVRNRGSFACLACGRRFLSRKPRPCPKCGSTNVHELPRRPVGPCVSFPNGTANQAIRVDPNRG